MISTSEHCHDISGYNKVLVDIVFIKTRSEANNRCFRNRSSACRMRLWKAVEGLFVTFFSNPLQKSSGFKNVLGFGELCISRIVCCSIGCPREGQHDLVCVIRTCRRKYMNNRSTSFFQLHSPRVVQQSNEISLSDPRISIILLPGTSLIHQQLRETRR